MDERLARNAIDALFYTKGGRVNTAVLNRYLEELYKDGTPFLICEGSASAYIRQKARNNVLANGRSGGKIMPVSVERVGNLISLVYLKHDDIRARAESAYSRLMSESDGTCDCI